MQESIAGDPDLNKQGVPRIVDFATTPEQMRDQAARGSATCGQDRPVMTNRKTRKQL